MIKDLTSSQTYQPQVGDNFKNHDEFVNKIKSYARNLSFVIRLGKVEYVNTTKNKEQENITKQLRKRTLLCSRAGYSEPKESILNNENSNIKERNQKSQRCNCSFYIRASLDSSNGLWYIINMNLTHNHQMVDEYHQFFMSNERSIPDDVKQRIALLRHAGVDVPTIRAILKESLVIVLHGVYKVLEQFKYDNDEFFYYIDVNNNTQRLERVIWMFPEQHINYSRFNDIVVFNNTYKTNRFQMPFGIFTGVNNYGYSICFADALMIDETLNVKLRQY
ncbi:hypothetical protein RhiirA4_486536 [Rhizophagus irregularis]|uniref:FAR1 domain-containing protein n=1 Tax=Rhizophagus irregularis TaxID=588596 RepID=A0A2I1HRG9_9GLOM|nr:hypothetical protein RhiirA4_486536 [Rhizophagus irregularis]